MSTRTVNHVVVTNGGTVHYASDSPTRPRHVLGCNGRAISGMGDSLGAVMVTCKACRKAVKSERILLAAVDTPEQPTYADEITEAVADWRPESDDFVIFAASDWKRIKSIVADAALSGNAAACDALRDIELLPLVIERPERN